MIPFSGKLWFPLFCFVATNLVGLNTYAALIIPRASNAFGIFLLRQFFKGIPIELEGFGIC
jgi:multiple sugar transport system permease protein